MRLTVLGKSPSWPDAGGACSGYLVDDGETCILLECGTGVFAKLRAVRDYASVDAVVISHMHGDHFADLIPYACALTYGPREHPPRPQLLLPAGGAAALRTLEHGGGHSGELACGAFDMSEYDAAGGAGVRTLRMRFQPVPHFIATNAIELTSSASAGRVTFGADHGDTAALDTFADATDLLILEATLMHADPEGSPGHLTPAQAGAIAARCNARRLVLTHISDELDCDHARAEAERVYEGPVEVAREGAVYDLSMGTVREADAKGT